jgi:hypothetical protein
LALKRPISFFFKKKLLLTIEIAYCDDLQKLKDHFKEFNNVHFLQGLIPDCLDQLNVEKISFLYIDLNAAKPEIEGLTLLWDRLAKGVSCCWMTTGLETGETSMML